MKSSTCSAPWDFLLPFSFFLYSHITSCIRDSLHFAPRFAPSKCVRCGTSLILLSRTIMKSPTCSAPWDFLLPFPFFLYSHITSCIRDSLHFVRRFAPSKCVRCGTSSILLSPTIMKSSTCSAPWDFLLPFPFFYLQSYNLLHPRLTTFCASLRSFKMCSLRNQFDPVIAQQKKASRAPLRRIFYCHFPFPSFVIPPALKKSIASHPLKGYNT